MSFLSLFLDKIEMEDDLTDHLDLIFATAPVASSEEQPELEELNALESTGQMRSYLAAELSRLKQQGSEFVPVEAFSGWTSYFKQELKIKGKPLFKGMRLILTGRISGGDLSALVPITPIDVLLARVS